MDDEVGAIDHDAVFAARRAADQRLVGLEVHDATTASFTLTRPLSRHDGRLYGGTAVAAAIAMAEHGTGRPSLWTTVQFVSGAASVGDRIDCEVEVLASGRRTSQVRVIARLDDRELFCALGATARPKDRAVEGVFETFPRVAPPEECTEFRFPIPEQLQEMIERERLMEMRIANDLSDAERPSGEVRLWVRISGFEATPAVIGYLADMVPMSVVKAAGRVGVGTSLDNTLRMAHPTTSEWVLLQLDPHLARGGYGTGTGHVWAPDGTYLATASQTAALLVLD